MKTDRPSPTDALNTVAQVCNASHGPLSHHQALQSCLSVLAEVVNIHNTSKAPDGVADATKANP